MTEATAFAVIILLWLFYLILRFLGARAKERLEFVWRRGITHRYALATEVDLAYDTCAGLYGTVDHIINKDSLRDFMTANQKTVKFFFRTKQPSWIDVQAIPRRIRGWFSKGTFPGTSTTSPINPSNPPVGLYIVFAINREAVRRYLDGTFTNAQVLRAKYAVSERGRPVGLYVSNIAANPTVSARGIATEVLRNDLIQLIRRYRSIEYIFARVANADGERLIRREGFEKIRADLPKEQIWKKHIALSRHQVDYDD